jgi:hypothetical protein
LYRFLPVTEAFNLECLIPYPLALAGMTLFLCRLALPASAAIFGGLTFAFSAYLTLRLAHLNALAVLAHLGWLLLAIDVLLRDEGRARVRAWLGLALLTGSQWLVGYPVAIAFGWLIAIPYALYAAVQVREAGFARLRSRRATLSPDECARSEPERATTSGSARGSGRSGR